MSVYLPIWKTSGEAEERPVSGVMLAPGGGGGDVVGAAGLRGPGVGAAQPIGVEGDSLEALRASLDEAVHAALKSFHVYVAAAVSARGFSQGVSGALPGEPFPRRGFEPGAGPPRAALDAGIKAQLDAALATAFAEEKRAMVEATTTPFPVPDPRTEAVGPGAGALPGAPPIVSPVPMPVPPPVEPPPVFPGGQPPAPEPFPAVGFNFAALFRANGQRHS